MGSISSTTQQAQVVSASDTPPAFLPRRLSRPGYAGFRNQLLWKVTIQYNVVDSNLATGEASECNGDLVVVT